MIILEIYRIVSQKQIRDPPEGGGGGNNLEVPIVIKPIEPEPRSKCCQ